MRLGITVRCGYNREYQKMEEYTETISNSRVGQMNYAGFWLRLGGFIIDGLIVFIVTAPLGVWASVSTPWLKAGGYLVAAPFILLSIAFVIGFLYFTLFWTWRGQTPGKMLIRVKVVRTNGEALSFERAALRFLGIIICFLTIYIGFIIVAFNIQKRGLHDTIADTCVIKLGARLTKDNKN